MAGQFTGTQCQENARLRPIDHPNKHGGWPSRRDPRPLPDRRIEVEIATHDRSGRVRQAGRNLKRQSGAGAGEKRITRLVVGELLHQRRSMKLSTGAIGKN